MRTFLLCLGAAALACAPESNSTAEPDPVPSFRYRASVEQLHLWKSAPGAAVRVERNGVNITTATTDEQGSLVLRKLAPGGGYVVHIGEERTPRLEVLSVEGSAPPPSFYSAQQLVPGFQYLTTRDGTKLSAYVTFPPGPGPFPTVVNYSGYNASEPGYKIGDFEWACGSLPALCDAPQPEASLFAALDGYATVNVNIRGTGCSGGAYDYFEPLELLDGYDVIEIVAAQEWVAFHKVGMVGLSYPGITQLFVARLRPPGLAAIAPLSVIGNTATTLVPGGILNDGFAMWWVSRVLDRAAPYGQGWERKRVDDGDTVCEDNQLLHSQRVDNVEQARSIPYYVPAIVDPLNPEKFVGDITVPVFIAGAWQDEQTGPWFGSLLDKFVNAPALRITVQNGVHVDQYAPAIFHEWLSFLDLFVARKVPWIPPLVRTMSPALFQETFGAEMDMPPDRFGSYASYEDAVAAWQAEPRLRVIFESGAGGQPGAPQGTFEKSFPSWPAPHAARRWYFQPDGSLGDGQPTAAAAASEFIHDPEAGGRGIIAPGSNEWNLLPVFDWRFPAEAGAVVMDSAPLEQDLAMLGTGSVDLWVRSTASEADLEVNLSELRPDGQEIYVQSGWLRVSQRMLGADSTELLPAPTHQEQDARPLVPGEWVQARVAIAPFGHAFRAGSRVRICVDSPGDSRAQWRFALAPVPAGTRIAIGHDAAHASSVALPVLQDSAVPTPLPACTLRGQQCREARAFTNAAAAP